MRYGLLGIHHEFDAALRDGSARVNNDPSELLLVDTDALRVLHRRKLPNPLALLHVDQRAVYFAPQGRSTLYQLPADDPQNRRRTLLDGPPTGMGSLPSGRLVVRTAPGQLTVLDQQSLSRLPDHPLDGKTISPTGQLVYPLSDGCAIVGQRVLDKSDELSCYLGRPELLRFDVKSIEMPANACFLGKMKAAKELASPTVRAKLPHKALESLTCRRHDAYSV